MANEFLQGIEVAGGLAGRAQQMRMQQEQLQEMQALAPLKQQEAEDRLHLNALEIEKGQYERDLLLNMKTGLVGLSSKMAQVKDWSNPVEINPILDDLSKNPMLEKTAQGQFAVNQIKGAQAGKQKIEELKSIRALPPTPLEELRIQTEQEKIASQKRIQSFYDSKALPGASKPPPEIFTVNVPGKGKIYTNKNGTVIDPRKFMTPEVAAEEAALRTQLNETAKALADESANAKPNMDRQKRLQTSYDAIKKKIGELSRQAIEQAVPPDLIGELPTGNPVEQADPSSLPLKMQDPGAGTNQVKRFKFNPATGKIQ